MSPWAHHGVPYPPWCGLPPHTPWCKQPPLGDRSEDFCYITIVIYVFVVLFDVGPKWVHNWSGMVPKTLGTLLGHFWETSFVFGKTKYETPTCLKTVFV